MLVPKSFYLPKVERPREGFAILLLGLAVYLAVQLGMNVWVAAGRNVPYGTDDAYTYLLKAVEMKEGCFLQNCLALDSLRQQFSIPEAEEGVDWMRYRADSRVFLVYHPLHSAIVVGVQQFTGDWEWAYELVLFAGVVGLALGAAAFMTTLWGARAAGLALVLLSVTLLPQQGLHLIVPSNLALMVALFTWSAILRYRERSAWIVVGLILLALLLHPIAKLYAVMSLLLLLTVDARRPSLGSLAPYAAGAALIAAAVLLPHFITHPMLAYNNAPVDHPFWPGVRNNLLAALEIFKKWDARSVLAGRFMGFVMLGLTVLGVGLLEPARRKQQLLLASGLVTIMAASMFHVLPPYWGELFSRLYPIWALIAAGGVGLALIGLSRVACNPASVLSRYRCVPVIFCAAFCLFYLVGGSIETWRYAFYLREHDDMAVDKTQGRQASALCGTVFYANEATLMTYLVDGVLHCRSVALQALSLDPDRRTTLQASPEPHLFVASNPAGYAMPLEAGGRAKIALNETVPGPLKVRIAAERVGSVKAVVRSAQGDESIVELSLPAQSDDWYVVSDRAGEAGSTITVTADSGGERPLARLSGFAAGDGQQWDWPWNQDVTLTHSFTMTVSWEFSAKKTSHELFTRFEPIATGGVTMLARARK